MSATPSLRWLVVFMSTLMLGCERLPSGMPSSTSIPADVVTDTGRGTYDWNLNRLQGELSFDVARQTSFKFAEQLDTEVIKKNLHPIKYLERAESSKPDWMDDDVHVWLRRFTEMPPTSKSVLSLKVDGQVGKVFSMNRGGTRLITVGTRLIEWDIETGERISDFVAPMAECRQGIYDSDGKSIVLQGVDKLYRVSLADGQVKHSWSCPEGEIRGIAKARDKDVIAVVTSKMGMVALSSNFEVEQVYKGVPLVSSSIAVQPDGKHVLGTVDGNLLTWQLAQPDAPANYRTTTQFDKNMIASSGAMFDRWSTPHVILEYVQETGEPTTRDGITHTGTNGLIASSANGTVEGPEDWLIVLSARGNFDGTNTRFIEDILPAEGFGSAPWTLPVQNAERIATNCTGEVIAIQSDDQVQVFKRRRWIDPDGMRTAMRMALLLDDGRFEQLDKIAEYFRSQPVVRGNRTGEAYYGELVNAVAARWHYWESRPDAAETLSKIEQWQKSGSLFAGLASAVRHQNIGLAARGGGLASSVSADGWKTMEDRIQRSNQELKQILDNERPPAKAIEEFISNMRYSEGTFQDTERLLKRYTELYPHEYQAYVTMCYWLLPRWGGELGEGGALVGAVADRYPSPESESFYAQVVISMTGGFQRQILPETGLNESRAVKAADMLIQREQLAAWQTELLMEMAYSIRDQVRGDRLGRYHLKHFDIPTRHTYQRPSVGALFRLKLESFKASP